MHFKVVVLLQSYVKGGFYMRVICQQSCRAATEQSKASKLVWEYSIQHLTLISGVVVPLRVTDGRFYLGALLLEMKVFRI